MKPTVMLIGLGHLGGVVLELLAREPGLGRIVACSRDEARGAARCALARMGATAQGHEPRIDYRRLDLGDTESAAALIDRERPDLILTTATLQTWWLPELLPAAAAAPLAEARFGAWLPIHLPLVMRLMQATREAGFRGVTLTAPFPDVVNVVLARRGIAPTCGIGNLDEIVPKVRWLVAEALRAPLRAVRVYLVAHHALEPFAYGARRPAGDVPPHFLRVEIEGRDVTREVRAEELLLSPCPLPGGPAWAFLTAGSAVRLIAAILAGGETLLHAPAPGGRPGGYPVLAGDGRVRPAPVPGLDAGEAIALNERSHRFDGIERIEDDGTVVFTDTTADLLHRTLGFDCARLRPEEAEARGRELVTRFRDYAAQHGVRLEGRG